MSSARPASSPPARPRRVAWRDPRLAVGVLLVAGSVVLGALVLGGEDAGSPVWQVRSDVAAGSVLDPADLTTVRVPLPDVETRAAYVSAAEALPEGRVLRRGLAAGELLPAAALEAVGPALAQVPVPTTEAGVPGTVRPGSVVDVWVSPAPTGVAAPSATPAPSRAEQVLDDVVVVSLPDGVSLGGGAPQPLVVGVDQEAGTDLGQVLAQLAVGTAVVVGQGR